MRCIKMPQAQIFDEAAARSLETHSSENKGVSVLMWVVVD